jgi:hypothetical protein
MDPLRCTRRSVQFEEWSLTLSEDAMPLESLRQVVIEANSHAKTMKDLHGPEATITTEWEVSPEYPAESLTVRVTVEASA